MAETLLSAELLWLLCNLHDSPYRSRHRFLVLLGASNKEPRLYDGVLSVHGIAEVENRFFRLAHTLGAGGRAPSPRKIRFLIGLVGFPPAHTVSALRGIGQEPWFNRLSDEG